MKWKREKANSDVSVYKIYLAVSVQCLCVMLCDSYLQMTIGTFEVVLFRCMGKPRIFELRSLSSNVTL